MCEETFYRQPEDFMKLMSVLGVNYVKFNRIFFIQNIKSGFAMVNTI